MRTITVKAEFSGTLPTGSYANMKPGFSATETMEVGDDFSDQDLSQRQMELQEICHKSFEQEAERARIYKIEQDIKDFRFYPTATGEKYPSVTSVQGFDKNFFVSDDDLTIYAAQGNIIDAEIRNYVNSGCKEYKHSGDLLECTADRFIIKSRKLASGKQLSLNGWDFPAFLEKYPITDLKSVEKPVFNHNYRYAGTPDLTGVYNGLQTLVSLKRTKSATDNFTQEAAYAKCEGMEHIQQMMVVEMKSEADGGNKQGYSKPIVSQEIDRFFELFLRKRTDFKKIYSI